MLALPLTPKSPRVLLDFDCAPTYATSSPTMVVPSYERPSSPSVFTPTTMTESRSQTASQKRPKLSLQTSSLPITFGKSSTALSIAASALPTASPTILNTFNNAYDVPHRFSPAPASPTGSRIARASSRLVSPFASSKDERPYQVSLGLKSILRNSPVLSGLRRSSLCLAGDSPRAGRRAFFPAPKKVTFRVVVEEEIQTTTYTAKHSDLSSDEEDSDSDERSGLPLSSSEESDADEPTTVKSDPETTQRRKKRKAGSDRQIQAAAIRDCIADAKRLQKRFKPTFELRGKRRRRHWEWTLEPWKETSPHPDTAPQVKRSDLSPSQIPLPLSAALDRGAALLSPSKAPLPASAPFAALEDKVADRLLSPSLIPLPPSATLSSPTSSAASTNAEDENPSFAAVPPRTDRQ